MAESTASPPPVPGCGLEVRDITFSYDGSRSAQVLSGVSIEARRGELLSLLGPSGCGKTTLLRIVAGLEEASSGSVRVEGRLLTDAGKGVAVAPAKRGVAMVFQNWALFPHMDVAQNITFGMPRALRNEGGLLAETLSMVGLEGLERRKPSELSGGQQQRVALGRAMAQRPDLLLLDEPFSNLDPELRSRVRGEVRELLKSLGTTTVLVTHDHEEALLLGDRLVLLRDGAVVASGDPVDLYRHPPDRWSAGFLGEVVTLSGVARGGHVRTVLGELRCSDGIDGAVEVMLRPEELVIDTLGSPSIERGVAGEATGGVSGTVAEVAFRGAVTVYSVILDGVPIAVTRLGAPVAAVGEGVIIRGPSTSVTIWPET